MLRHPESNKRSITKSGKLIVYARGIVLSLTLLALAGSPGETARVRAQGQFPPAAIAARLNINIGGNGTYCVGQDYPIFVTPVSIGGAIEVDPVTHKEKSVDAPIEAVAVEAFSTNTGVATIAPKKAVSGFDVTGYRVSAANFSLHANKPGSTRIYFEASIRGNYAGPGVDIKVVNCRYQITIKGTSAGSGDNIALTQVYTATGEIAGDQSAALTGDAQVTWHMTQSGDCYTASKTTPPSAVHLKGSLSEDGGTLTVNVTFDALTVTTTVRAAGLCARSGATATAQGQLQLAPIVFKVPGTGGGDSQPFTLPNGAVTLTGTATITVVPLAIK